MAPAFSSSPSSPPSLPESRGRPPGSASGIRLRPPVIPRSRLPPLTPHRACFSFFSLLLHFLGHRIDDTFFFPVPGPCPPPFPSVGFLLSEGRRTFRALPTLFSSASPWGFRTFLISILVLLALGRFERREGGREGQRDRGLVPLGWNREVGCLQGPTLTLTFPSLPPSLPLSLLQGALKPSVSRPPSAP
jgi:hypothetical protein